MKTYIFRDEIKTKKDNVIKNGYVLLCSNNTFLSKAIRFFQKNKYSHAGLFIYINDMLFVAEATKRGITLTNYYHYINNKNYIIKILAFKDYEKIDYNKYFTLIMNNLSKPYDYFSLFIFEPIRFIFKKWIGKRKKGNDRFMCGEFVAYVYNNLFENMYKNWYEIAPVDIEKDTENFNVILVF